MASTRDLRVENLFSVKGYVCLVTGGGTGIGLMASQVLAANGSTLFPCFGLFADRHVGAKVYITGRRMEALEQAAKSHNPSDGGEIIP